MSITRTIVCLAAIGASFCAGLATRADSGLTAVAPAAGVATRSPAEPIAAWSASCRIQIGDLPRALITEILAEAPTAYVRDGETCLLTTSLTVKAASSAREYTLTGVTRAAPEFCVTELVRVDSSR